MPYSDFTFQSLRDKLALHLRQDASLFAHVEEAAVSEYLQTTLQENVALALNINTGATACPGACAGRVLRWG